MNRPFIYVLVGAYIAWRIVYYIGLLVHTHDKTPTVAAPLSVATPEPSEGEPQPL